MSINRKDQAREAIAYKLYKATKPTNLTPALTYGNATTTGSYVRPVMASSMADANDHMSYASRDSGAMIVRI